MTTTTFIVRGEFEVPVCRTRDGGRAIYPEQVAEFWDEVNEGEPDIANGRGCYVFAIRVGRGMTPGYIGRTVLKSFEVEVFHPTKLLKYNYFLNDYKRGTPVVFFLLAENGRGNQRHVKDLETFLIQTAVKVNPRHLQNIQGTAAEQWSIEGVLRGGRGHPKMPARRFKDLLKL